MPPPANTLRTPMSIDAGTLDIGADSTRFVPGDTDSLLRSYLTMVRRTRDQRRAASITLRREDIELIAEHLGQSSAMVLGRLADLMGSTRTQRTAMLTLLATGAMLIAVTGSAAAEAPRSARSTPGEAGSYVTLEVVEQHQAGRVVSAASPTASSELAVPTARREVGTGPGGSAIEVTEAGIAAAVSTVTTVEQPTGDRPTTRSEVPSAETEVGVIGGDDGERVLAAVGAPPVPPEFDQPADEPLEPLEPPVDSDPETGVSDVGSTVAVGPPPIPPPPVSAASSTGVADDGSTVAVGSPPVPQPPTSSEASTS